AVLDVLKKKCSLLYNEGEKTTLKKYQQAVKSGVVDLQFFATKALLFTYTCVQLGYSILPKAVARTAAKKAPAGAAASSGAIAPVQLEGEATMAQATLCMDKASFSAENQLHLASRMYSDMGNFYTQTMICRTLGPL
ncbi:unnamed protein product, partial [Prorocentrum cordatum]